MTTSTKIERLAAALKARNIDCALIAKVPDEFKKRISVKNLVWMIDALDQLQRLTAQLESISEGYPEDQVLEESKC